MKQMLCPLNGLRNISEFIYGGEVQMMPDISQCSDRLWAEYVFYHRNPLGLVKEWWCHSATSYWFIAERDTRTDEIIKTYDADVLFKEPVHFPSSD